MDPSFEDVYQEHLPGVWAYVRVRVPGHHEAQDVTGDVFVRALRSWPSYDPMKGTVGAWLFRITHHTVVDWWRRHRPGGEARETPVTDLADRTDTETEDLDEHLLREESIAGLREAMRGLAEREQEALALRFGAGLRAREVGEVLGISEGAAKMLVHRAVTKLRKAMADG